LSKSKSLLLLSSHAHRSLDEADQPVQRPRRQHGQQQQQQQLRGRQHQLAAECRQLGHPEQCEQQQCIGHRHPAVAATPAAAATTAATAAAATTAAAAATTTGGRRRGHGRAVRPSAAHPAAQAERQRGDRRATGDIRVPRECRLPPPHRRPGGAAARPAAVGVARGPSGVVPILN